MYKNSKLCAIISYFFWIGWVIALCLRDKDDTLVRRHLNQALILNIAEVIIGCISRRGWLLGLVGGVLGLICLVLCIMGIIRAAKLSEEPLPFIGEFELIH